MAIWDVSFRNQVGSINHSWRDFGRQMARDQNGILNSAEPDRNTFKALRQLDINGDG